MLFLALVFPFMCWWCLQALISNVDTKIHNKEPGKSYSLAFIRKIIFCALLPHYSLRQFYRKCLKGLLLREAKSWLYSGGKWSHGNKMTINRSSPVTYQSVKYFHIVWHLFREEWQRQPEGIARKQGLRCARVCWGLWPRWGARDPQPLCRVLALGMVLREEANSSWECRAGGASGTAPLGQGDEGESGETAPQTLELSRDPRWDPRGQNPPWHRGKVWGGGRSCPGLTPPFSCQCGGEVILWRMEELGVKGKNAGLGKRVVEDKSSLCLWISPPNSILIGNK